MPQNKKYYNSLNIKDHMRNTIYILLIGILCIPFGYMIGEIVGIFGVCFGTGLIFVVRYGIGAILPWEFKKFIKINT